MNTAYSLDHAFAKCWTCRHCVYEMSVRACVCTKDGSTIQCPQAEVCEEWEQDERL